LHKAKLREIEGHLAFSEDLSEQKELFSELVAINKEIGNEGLSTDLNERLDIVKNKLLSIKNGSANRKNLAALIDEEAVLRGEEMLARIKFLKVDGL
jgi:hypothetical protein